jgi:hypothetical protein
VLINIFPHRPHRASIRCSLPCRSLVFLHNKEDFRGSKEGSKVFLAVTKQKLS